MMTALAVSKNEQKEIRVEIQLPPDGFPKVMYFNRFRVERGQEFCLVQFGLMSDSGLLLDHYSCILPRMTLDQNQPSLLHYLGRVGRPQQHHPPPWQGLSPALGQKTEVVDIIGMAVQNEMAETCLWVFSLRAAPYPKPSVSPASVPAQPLALLRSSGEMQKQLIVALYEE